MHTGNPLLAETPLPSFSAVRPEHVLPAIETVLSDYRARIDALTASGAARDFESVMLEQERLEQRLNRAWAPVSHLHSVADTPELREAYSEALEKITDFTSELGQNRALHAVVEALAERGDFPGWPRARRAAVEHALRDFKLAGVTLEEPARTRFREIASELTRFSTEFANAVLDATDAWHEHVTEGRDLAGIPESGRAVLREYARERGLEGFLVTLKQPSVDAVLTWADNRTLRERVYRAYQTRASDQGPDAGKFDNSRRIENILALRHEAARLLGFENAAQASLATRMARSTGEVLEFLRDLVHRAKPVAQHELDELRAFARDRLDIETLEAWDVSYAAEKLRQERYALDEEELKPFFPAPAVMDGLFALAEKLYGIRLRAREGLDVWHPDVRYFDVLDPQGNVIAGCYLDLYARSGKRGGAWMDVCRARFR
ncbi:MAG: M3 family metallopeptidase, partial [Rhodanobacteraceae bacterium]